MGRKLTEETRQMCNIINNAFAEIVKARLVVLRACFKGQKMETREDIAIEKEYKFIKKAWKKGKIDIYKSSEIIALSEQEVKYILNYLNTGEMNDDLTDAIDNFNKVTFRIFEM